MKLFVAGCSVSDYSQVDEVYGEILAKKLNIDYVHEGSGCGSNWRIWRKIVNHVINNNLTSDDLLVIQYTTLERREFWSYNEKDEGNGKLKLRERYNNPLGGDIIKFKSWMYEYQDFKNESQLFKLIETQFTNPYFDMDIFQTQNLMFQCLLKEYNIPTIFFGFYHNDDTIKLIPHFKNSYFHVDEIKENINYLLTDMAHFNENGHYYVADKMYDFIKNNNYLKNE